MARKFKRYNNGIKNIIVYEGDSVPEGFVAGTVPWSNEKKKEVTERRKQTNLQKYGVDNPSKSDKVKEKIKKANLERYGVDNPAKLVEVQDKAKETMMKKYGVEHALQSEELKKKQKQSCVERLGVENAFQSEEIKEKSKQTLIKKYGVENASQSEEIKQKKITTSLERYGTEHPWQSEEVKSKSRETSLKKYGKEYPIMNKDVQEKQIKTNLEKYGVEHPLQSSSIKDTLKQTNLERYGVENVSQSEGVKSKRIETFIERYGVDNPSKSDEIKKKTVETNTKRYGVRNIFQSSDIKEKIQETNIEKYGVPWSCMRPEARQGYSNDSVPNKEFEKLLEDNGITYEREFPIGRYSYDFKVGNTLIEIDPFATHNTLWNPFGREGVSETYHRDKSKAAMDNGYNCIHVFDWDDIGKIINLLKQRETVYARKCKIQEVTYEDATRLLSINHLQGSCKGQDIRLGLYYNNELVSLMTFGKPRYNKNYQWELLRYCSSKNVIGGAQKLFMYFIKKYNPNTIISYCDRSKFQGKVYTKIGFKLKSDGSPSCHWYSPKENRHITDNLLRQRGFDQLFNENYGKGTSNEELIIERGYLPIYDCGQSTYTWRNEP